MYVEPILRRRRPIGGRAPREVWGPVELREDHRIRVGGAEIRVGYAIHPDGKPLWFAEGQKRRDNPQWLVQAYGDSKDEAVSNLMAHIETEV